MIAVESTIDDGTTVLVPNSNFLTGRVAIVRAPAPAGDTEPEIA
jgi:hypothetical protein